MCANRISKAALGQDVMQFGLTDLSLTLKGGGQTSTHAIPLMLVQG